MITIEIEPVAVNSVDRHLTFRMLGARLREASLEALACLLNGALDDEVTVALGRKCLLGRQIGSKTDLILTKDQEYQRKHL